ncbi:hypothetical protein N7509_002698 [Penicillium cosmopolitanum]|uniref:Transcription factor domain-containing protein n=1 Tax=Penicillium cosmopolitanum TaxID=1131564 RepID=A0A9W9W9A6_9EURO|nr:uncharacterized protein N7509_002698 [Penicillium cosmopolitanum]KAJ5408815.1 hypothetical protein N7509_002698 [Penicillium cosmopolitanum]
MSEKRHPLESFVGRMMNHQAELMTWRGELPSHLAPKYAAASEDERAWSNMSWVQRQCFDIELHLCQWAKPYILLGFNHVMLVLHRPFFADTIFSTPFYSSLMARSVCLGAARETILLSNKVLVDGPGVQHWSCYYHRVLAATLLTLECGLESALEERNSFVDLWTKSVDIFKSMPPGCSKKGMALVEGALAQVRDQALRSTIAPERSANVA